MERPTDRGQGTLLDGMAVRVRYAPSPTGSPHVGNIRTALFDYLFAKHHGGVNILRLEDTDRTRYVEGCEAEILESLRYVGVGWQEGIEVGGPHGPYRQSERKELGIYDRYVQQLLDSGAAYWAFDTPEELAEMREYQQINKQLVGYFGGLWRDATPAQAEEARAQGKPCVIRLRIPRNESIVVHDAIRGRVEVDSNTVDDPVLIKADGMPTYHFAAMVDDRLMDITHVFRGEEWISSAPKHVVLFRAFGWEAPEFVHVPVIKGKDGKKLGKRHGDTACLDFRRAGYLPEALANFIALIGWSPGGDRELMTMDEMAEAFDLPGIQPSPGVFDLDKLNWMNGHYMRALPAEELTRRVEGYCSSAETAAYWQSRKPAEGKPDPAKVLGSLNLLGKKLNEEPEMAKDAIGLERERVTTLADFGEATAFLFLEEPPMDEKAVAKWLKAPHAGTLFDDLIAALEPLQSVTHDDCEGLLRDWGAAHGFEKLGPVVHPTRVALTGKTVGPGLFELMAVLGPERMVRRLRRAKALLG